MDRHTASVFALQAGCVERGIFRSPRMPQSLLGREARYPFVSALPQDTDEVMLLTCLLANPLSSSSQCQQRQTLNNFKLSTADIHHLRTTPPENAFGSEGLSRACSSQAIIFLHRSIHIFPTENKTTCTHIFHAHQRSHNGCEFTPLHA